MSSAFRSAMRISRELGYIRSFSTQRQATHSVKRYLIPLGVCTGTGYLGYQFVYKGQQVSNGDTSGELQVDIYRLLPLNATSRLWGRLNSVDLPGWIRSPVLRLYVWLFGCNLEEAANPNLTDYKNLGQFFQRDLKPDCRPVDKAHPVVCPSDGIILDCGKVTEDQVKHVKGVTYTLSRFMGPQTFSRQIDPSSTASETTINQTTLGKQSSRDYEDGLKHNQKNNLYQCVIYLAPGDYHHFHSPTNWSVSYRRHFPGYLLSVNPRVVRRIPELFNLNERVVYFGNWHHGFFAMALVGATNVGSIHVYTDENLSTNKSTNRVYSIDQNFENRSPVMSFNKGAPFGEFSLGSTVVLVFEGPETLKFTVEPGQKVKFGQPLAG